MFFYFVFENRLNIQTQLYSYLHIYRLCMHQNVREHYVGWHDFQRLFQPGSIVFRTPSRDTQGWWAFFVHTASVMW